MLTQAQADSVVSAPRVTVGWLTEPGQPVVPGETVEARCLTTVTKGLVVSGASASAVSFPRLAQEGDPADRFAAASFYDNPNLTAITLGPAAISGYLIIRNNAELSDISHIAAGLRTGNTLEIGNNPKLCQSQIDALLARVTFAQKLIYSNKAGC